MRVSDGRILGDDLGIATENTAKWQHNHLLHGTTFQPGQLVIIDETSLAGALSLDRITHLAHTAGTKVLLVGDYAQLQSVDAGGAFAMITKDRADTPEPVGVHRFTHAWEKTASLALRHGHPHVIDTYLDHQSITDGDHDTMTDAAYTAWRADRAQGTTTDTARSVLYGVLQHSGAELSAHKTIAAAAQHDRWATLLRTSGLTTDEADRAIGSDAFSPLTAELRRAEANHHDLDALLPRLVAPHAGSATPTTSPRSSNTASNEPSNRIRSRTQTSTPHRRPHPTSQRRDRHRNASCPPRTRSNDQGTRRRRPQYRPNRKRTLDKAFGTPPSDQHQAAAWRRASRVVAAYRDRYHITSQTPLRLGTRHRSPEIDAARARAAFNRVLRISEESLTSAAGLQAARRSQAQTGRSM